MRYSKHPKYPKISFLQHCKNEGHYPGEPSTERVKEVNIFPNGMASVYDYHGNQIQDLQGLYTKKLRKKIKKRSDSKTKYYETTKKSI